MRESLIGKKYGMLNVSTNAPSKKGERMWVCICECGGTIELTTSKLNSGNTKSCGCLHNREDITGNKYGQLTVMSKLDTRRDASGRKELFWLCKCDCGNVKELKTSVLKSGDTESCGCGQFKGNKGKHNLVGTREYNIHQRMISRCYNEKCDKYKYYGGRGIKVCDRWKNSVADFVEDMGMSPTNKHSIDRIDVNGDYDPSNCRWATQKEQMNNTTSNRIIEFNGQKLTLSQWCDKYNRPYDLISNRLRKGWNIEDSIMTPKGKKPKKCTQ